ncbi:MAG: prepilin peptidase [Clostridiales bacterium]|nr:prepilin peptidase [Clostridiales bacterium]
MTTNPESSKLITDLKSIPSPVFYIFAAVAVFSAFFVLGLSVASVFVTLFLLLLVACAAADINSGIVPELVLIVMALLGIINFLVVEGWSLQGVIDHVIGAVCVSVPMLILALIIKGAFGGGDIKLMAAAGLFLGWHGAVVGAVLGMFISGFYGMYLLILKKATSHSKIKLAPFLSLGLGVAALFGTVIFNLFILRY